jgi:hypothetical protein
MSPVVAHRVDSLRCEGSDAIGAKRTCRERRKRVDLTKMTLMRHSLRDFGAVQHGQRAAILLHTFLLPGKFLPPGAESVNAALA